MAKLSSVALLLTLALASAPPTHGKVKELISFTIKATGGIWNQPRGIDSMVYICTDVIPYLSKLNPEKFPSQHWSSLCGKVQNVVNGVNEFDMVALCTSLSTDFENLRKTMPLRSVVRPFHNLRKMYKDLDTFFETMQNVIMDIYGVDPTMDFIARCQYANRTMIPSIPAQATEFTSKLMVASVPLGQKYLCDKWGKWDHYTGDPDMTMLNDLAQLGAKVLGFTDRAAVCQGMGAAMTAGDRAQKFAETVVQEFSTLFTDAEKCTGTSREIITALAPAVSRQEFIKYLRPLDFSSVDDLCVQLANAFAPSYSNGTASDVRMHVDL